MVQDTKHCEINILELMEPMIALKELAELDIAVPQPAETMVVINDYINSVDAIPKFLKDSVRTNDEYVEPAIASKSEIVVAILDGSVDTIEKSVKFIAEETAITENVPIFLKLTVEGSMDTANDIVKPVIVLKEDASIESSLETVENPVSKPDTVGESVNPMNVIQEIVTMENATESVGTSTCEGTMNIVDVMKPAEIAKPIAVVKEYVKTNEVGETVKPLLVLRETVETKNAAVDCSKSNDNIYNVEGIDTNLQEAMDTVVESMEHMAVQTLIEQTCIEYMKEVSKIVANTFNKLFTWAYFLGLFVLVASIAKKSLVGAPSIIQNPQTKLNPGIFNAWL
ncbi:hypothetical protein BC829DRAFT_400255 [Chytridium lagenaria]|nr:hypothetical protein BC829DRAFT_400255 [Chytridium lagenaria]